MSAKSRDRIGRMKPRHERYYMFHRRSWSSISTSAAPRRRSHMHSGSGSHPPPDAAGVSPPPPVSLGRPGGWRSAAGRVDRRVFQGRQSCRAPNGPRPECSKSSIMRSNAARARSQIGRRNTPQLKGGNLVLTLILARRSRSASSALPPRSRLSKSRLGAEPMAGATFFD